MSSQKQRTLDILNNENEVWLLSVPKSVSDAWKSNPRNTPVGVVTFGRSDEGQQILSCVELDKMDGVSLAFSDKSVAFPTYVYTEHTSGHLSVVGKVVGHYQLSAYTDFGAMPETVKSLKRMKIATEPIRCGEAMVINMSGRYVDHRGVVDRRIAASDEENINVLFQTFVGRERCSRKELNDRLQQPESVLKNLLARFCDVNKEKNSNWYSLKPEYRTKSNDSSI